MHFQQSSRLYSANIHDLTTANLYRKSWAPNLIPKNAALDSFVCFLPFGADKCTHFRGMRAFAVTHIRFILKYFAICIFHFPNSSVRFTTHDLLNPPARYTPTLKANVIPLNMLVVIGLECLLIKYRVLAQSVYKIIILTLKTNILFFIEYYYIIYNYI